MSKQVSQPVIKPAEAVVAVAPVIATSESEAKAFIYQHESGNRTDAINPSSGACGLGQALPCSKLPCSLSDYVCQDAWFSNYMATRYGSWVVAKAFWTCKGYCTSKYGTTYKTSTWW